jgi:serine/threonine protein phosphatase 1
MSKTYAIADLHGRFDLLEMALTKIAKRAEPPATLVTPGDYVDRIDPAFEPSLRQHRSPPSGNANLRDRDKVTETAPDVQSTFCRD